MPIRFDLHASLMIKPAEAFTWLPRRGKDYGTKSYHEQWVGFTVEWMGVQVKLVRSRRAHGFSKV
jgi:hypothetical protein